MRTAVLGAMLVAACGDNLLEPRTFHFGPYKLEPGEELLGECVSATLHNDAPIYVSQVELDTATGFHHSNWFFLPDFMLDGPDGSWRCADRGYAQEVAAAFGGVLFAQSTQATHEVQAFPPGAATRIPAHSKIVAGIHLLNSTDSTLEVPLAITVTPIAESEVTTLLSATSFEDQALAIPPRAASQFTVECDIGPKYQELFGRAPDFSFYYALPHYHELGTGLTIEVIAADGTAETLFSTAHRIGDALGGTLDPPFAMAGRSKLRFSCSYDNPSDATITWGYGGQEMCVFLTFTDSTYSFTGGALTPDSPGTGVVDANGVVQFTHDCQVIAVDATHF